MGLLLTGCGLIIIGLFILTGHRIPVRPGPSDGLIVSAEAAYAIGSLVILCGVYPIYLGIKQFLKSRRS